MKPSGSCESKGTGDLRRDTKDSADTSEAIMQDECCDVSMRAQDGVNAIDDHTADPGNCGRKDMGDLKQNIMDAVDTSKEIVRGELSDAQAEAEDGANAIDEQINIVAEKTQSIIDDIKKGSLGIAQSVKETAVNIARTVTSSTNDDDE